MDWISISISILALFSSAYIGYRQMKISQLQVKAQNKVELYLLTEIITYKDVEGKNEEKSVPSILIRNIGGNVVYLQKYYFNDTEYSLGEEVLPPVSYLDGYRYIHLPTNGLKDSTFEIYFKDWQGNNWVTTGKANLNNGIWSLTYSPCKMK